MEIASLTIAASASTTPPTVREALAGSSITCDGPAPVLPSMIGAASTRRAQVSPLSPQV